MSMSLQRQQLGTQEVPFTMSPFGFLSIRGRLGSNVTGGARIVVDENGVTHSVVPLLAS